MELLKRKDSSIYMLACEKKSYNVLLDVFGKELLDKSFIHCHIRDKFDDFIKDEINLKTLKMRFESQEELTNYIYCKLDELDIEKPLHIDEYLFQYFLPHYENEIERWGTRGNPYLYLAIARELSDIKADGLNEEILYKLFNEAYEKITNRKLIPEVIYYSEDFDPRVGGMSAGTISNDWFINILEELKERIRRSRCNNLIQN